MTAITYVAKRNIVPGTFSVTGSDISADSVTDSFSSTSTDLSGLSTGDYVYVTGFANDANNGWHILSGNSTTTNIPVSASALTTEAAGQTVTIGEYLHVAGTAYNLEDSSPAKLGMREEAQSSERVSLGGKHQSILHRIESGWDYQSGFIARADVVYWREFTQSVMAKEAFVFDPYGSIASPDDPITCVLDGGVTWSRAGARNDFFQVSFKVIAL